MGFIVDLCIYMFLNVYHSVFMPAKTCVSKRAFLCSNIGLCALMHGFYVCVVCVWISRVEAAGLGAARADGATESRGQLRTPQYVTSTGDLSLCVCAHVRECVFLTVSLTMHVFL